MDEADCAATMAFGMEAIAGGTDLLCIGEMGIGNTTVAAAIFAALFGGTGRDWVGPGTGSTTRPGAQARGGRARRSPSTPAIFATRSRCCAGSAAARSPRWPARSSPRAINRVPVIVDGYVATAAAAVLFAMDPARARPLPVRPRLGRAGHRRALERWADPLLDLGMRLGEGTARRWPRASSRRPPDSTRAWRPSPRRGVGKG